MNIECTGRHIDVTPAIRSHIEEHFRKIEQIFDGKADKAHIIIEVERGLSRSEVIINWRNEVLTANSTTPDMYQSISQTIDKIETQARRLKDKVIDKSHKATRSSEIAARLEPQDEAA
jgi:putative sigma-54 modulation protein